MLKKVLILALILNTSYMLPSDSPVKPDLAVSCAALALGIMCAWRACKDTKDFILSLYACTEAQRQKKILDEMRVKISKELTERGGGIDLTLSTYEVHTYHYTMEMPSDFSQEQVEKAKEHWKLYLTNLKKANEDIATWPTVGSVVLLTLGTKGIIEYIQLYLS